MQSKNVRTELRCRARTGGFSLGRRLGRSSNASWRRSRCCCCFTMAIWWWWCRAQRTGEESEPRCGGDESGAALVPWPSTTRLWPGPGGQPQSCLLSRDSWCVVAGSWAAQLELASRSRRRQSYLPPTEATAPCAPSSSHPLLSGDCPSSVPAAQRHGRARGRRAAARAHPCTPQNTAGDSADEPGIRNCKQRMQRRCGGGACVGRATLAHTTSELRQELVEDSAEHGRLRWRRLRRRRRRLRRWRWRRRGGQRATWRLGVPPVPQQRACAVSCIHPACMAPASGRAPLATLCGWPVLERGQLTLAPAVLFQQDVV